MESPESGNGAGDCPVGSIVWVRRRNGSWWPGKILGSDELPASHVISPRSGTPVKLLGREDASVDWYNMEKSKRVKAFRCGEFDDCIEKAEASQNMPPKKREKYARREDAIVHALELERQMLENKCEEEVDCSSDFNGGNSALVVVKEPIVSSENLESRKEGQLSPITEGGKVLNFPNEHDSKDKDLHPQQDKEENRGPGTDDKSRDVARMRGLKDKDLHPQQVKEENRGPGTDDKSRDGTRMRGLKDLGLRSVPSSLKNPPLTSSNGSGKSLLENGSSVNDGLHPKGVVNDYSVNSSEKRKRSSEGLVEDSLAKRHDRHYPAGQLLKTSAKGPVSVLQPDNGVNSIFKPEEEQTGIAHPAKKSRHTYLTSEGKAGSSNIKASPTPIEVEQAKIEEVNGRQASNVFEENKIESTEDTETDSSETDTLDSDSDEVASLSEGAASIELQPKYPGRGKPQKEYGSLSSEDIEDTSLPDEACQPVGNGPASTGILGVSRWQQKGKRKNRSLFKRPTNQSGNKFRSLLAGFGSRSPDGITTHRAMKWDRLYCDDQPASRGYLDGSVEYFDPLIVFRQQQNDGRVLLIEVDLKVQSSYERGHVPLISLMSKIDGRAMVGHPVQVEVLEDGSTDSLLLGSDDWSPENLEHDTAPPPMWRTARRTANFRIPRPDLSTYDERAKHHQYVDGKKGSSGPSNSGRMNHVSDKKSSKKASKKTSSSGNQKTRTLSSIASQHRRSGDPKSSGNQVAGLIKPESLPAAVACIPVKLVFSRLREELVGRHP